MRMLLFVYAYLPKKVHDPLRGYDWVPSYIREEAPIRVIREEGWYLIARIVKEESRTLIAELSKNFKQLKVVEKFTDVDPMIIVKDVMPKHPDISKSENAWWQG